MTTRQQIIHTAQLLFARHGYESTTTRDITKRAGVNVAAVNYHFGSKERLLVESLDLIVGPLNAERMQLLDELESKGDPSLNAVLRAFLLPDFHCIEQLKAIDKDLPRFVSRMYSEGSELMYSVMGRQFAESQARFLDAFSRVLPHLDEVEIMWRLHCIVGIIIYLFAGVESPGQDPMLSESAEENLRRMINVVAPFMAAPAQEVVPTQSS